MENELKELFLNHCGKISDKWSLYINEWDEIFSPFKKREINLLEIGIQNGGSLEIWAKYFSKAKRIIGCDIDEACQKLEFNDSRISVIVGDINTDDIEKEIIETAPELDIIIDDGSHKSSDIIRAFARYFKNVSDNGIYVIEDLHASYWNEFEGGLNNPYSAMAFLKRLADITNFEHWRNGQYRVNYLSPFIRHYNLDLQELDLCRIHSVRFFNSLCVIKKMPPSDNSLGKRIIVGLDELITSDWKKLNGTSIQDNATLYIDDSHMDIFSCLQQIDEKKQNIQSLNVQLKEKEQNIQSLNAQLKEKEQNIQSLNSQLKEKEQNIQSLNTQLNEKEQNIQSLNTQLNEKEQNIQSLKEEILFYALSKSWRFTRPFRKIVKLFRKENNVEKVID